MDNMSISDLRLEIDAIDGEIARLFRTRLLLVDAIGRKKRREQLPVGDPQREEEIIRRQEEVMSREDFAAYEGWMRSLFEICRRRQEERIE
ncbi:MAG: chorismate mutase [Tissierellia bacterium]|nr:chorismate mutase [Tissierellia bacterium]